MDVLRRNPALIPSVAFLAGASLMSEPGALVPSIPWLAGLVACGLALGGRWGGATVALAAGFWIVTTAPGDGLARLSAGGLDRRPVTLVGRVTSHPPLDGERSSVRLRVDTLTQGPRVERTRIDVWLSAEGIELPPFGSRVRVRGYARRSPTYENPIERPPGPWRMTLQSARFLTVEGRGGPLGRWATALRGWVDGTLGDGPPLVRALLLGDRSGLPKAWVQALRRASLAHVLAVSGLHVTVLAAWAWFLGSPLGRRGRWWAVVLTLGAYLLVLGPRPSALRATLMAGTALLALRLERPPQALNALACAAVFLVAEDPLILGDLGFRLSVAATAGILWLVPALAAWLPGPRALAAAVATTLAAQWGTLPWMLAASGGVHPASPILNVVLAPWLALHLGSAVVHLGLLGIGFERPWTGRWLDALEWPLEALASVPASSFWWTPCVALETWMAPLLLAGLWLGWTGQGAPSLADSTAHRISQRRNGGGGAHRVALASGAALVFGLALGVVMFRGDGAVFASQPAVESEVILFDVGQGDAILLRDRGRTVLVDGGGWPEPGDLGGRILWPNLARLGIRRLDAVVLTHPDRDHCGGLVDVARHMPVGEVWMAPGWTDPCAVELLTVPGPRWRVLWSGDRLTVGRWRLRVLGPLAGERRGKNDRSLVLWASLGARTLLLTGDLEAAGERRLMATSRVAVDVDPLAVDPLDVQVLKVGHHGSKTSTGTGFLRRVRPRLALISAGRRNPYGHPAPEVLARLGDHGVKTLRTDQQGMIRLPWPHRPPPR